ncbi:restriction endonuclease [Halomicrococcus sp. NG-SE-24]|uniref:restriction endonuclease n=1 Tax=Halomicrococcus sp. NG-SE-24 TaxID=3436928 RepID=UPI003D993FA8
MGKNASSSKRSTATSTHDRSILDDLSGHDFEDLMEDVFRNLGYENVRQTARTGDEGRDILMEEQVNGTRRGVVVECKHQSKVGREVVQKLHSAVSTYDFNGPKRGIVATTGEISRQAEEYASDVSNNSHIQIDLIDGNKLANIADDIGLDLYNGSIEIICTQMLRPSDPTQNTFTPVIEAFENVENIEQSRIPDPSGYLALEPYVKIDADTNAVFETSVGVIHRVNQHDELLIKATSDRPQAPSNDDLLNLVNRNFHQTITVDEDSLQADFEDITRQHFATTETEYKDWMVDYLRDKYTTTVEYTGNNNVDYEKTCEPNLSDVSVKAIEPVYVPRIQTTTVLQDNEYRLEYYAAGPSRVTLHNEIEQCLQCGESSDSTYTYCANCGSINCSSHIKTERIEQTPVCTGCAVTDRFMLSKKYFYNEENRAEFEEQYEDMDWKERAMENPALIGTVALTIIAATYLIATGAI